MKYLITTIAAVLVLGCGPSVPDISIHSATEKGNIEAVKQHLAAGTDVNTKDRIGFSPLHWAVRKGQKEIVVLLIAKGANVNAQNKIGMTPLHGAASDSRKEITDLLIAGGANVNGKTDRGITPLDMVATSVSDEAAMKESHDLLRKHGGKTGEELKAEGK
jgi:ankyrin repeat protein